jgi:hypothetical protein
MVKKLHIRAKSVVEGLVIAFAIISAETIKMLVKNDIYGNLASLLAIALIIIFIVCTRKK